MMNSRKVVLQSLGIAALVLGLAGCSDVHVRVDVSDSELDGAASLAATPTPIENAAADAEASEDATASSTGGSPEDPTTDAVDMPEQASPSTTSDDSQTETPTEPDASNPSPETEAGTSAEQDASNTSSDAQSSAASPSTEPAAVPTQAPLLPTPPSCASYQGQTYTVVLTEQQISAMLDAALQASQRQYVGVRSVSLQNGQITAQARYKGPGGQTVDGIIVVAVTARNYDLHVSIVQAQVGQVGMTDARKAALNTALEGALETEMAQAHDYTCVEAVTIASGTMTIVYY